MAEADIEVEGAVKDKGLLEKSTGSVCSNFLDLLFDEVSLELDWSLLTEEFRKLAAECLKLLSSFFVTVDYWQSESSNINLRALTTSLKIKLKIQIVLSILFGPNKLCRYLSTQNYSSTRSSVPELQQF